MPDTAARTVEAHVARVESLNAYDPEHELIYLEVTVDVT